MENISHFELGEKLGEGGAGVVYKARDIKLGRLVALKFLSPHLISSEDAIQRFHREARVVSNLDHPNIAHIYEAGEDQGRRFLVLEYLPGGTLSSQLRLARAEGKLLPLDRVLAWALQIANGLGYAHRHGVVHRDIKPSNLLCTDDGTVKITDFGLAKLVHGSEHSMVSGIAGTIPYMSPEQIRGEVIGHWTDIYSFGVLLHELAAGERPFHGPNDAAVLNAIAHLPPTPLRRLRPDAPPELERLLLRLMAKHPRERPQRMEDVIAAITAILNTHRSLSRSGTVTSLDDPTRTIRTGLTLARWKLPKWAQRTVLALSASIAALIAGILLWPSRCLLLPSTFAECGLPAYKHIGVLDFDVAGAPADHAMFKGLSDLLVTRLSRLARFDSSLCVHGILVPAEAGVVNLNITARIKRNLDSATIEAELWHPLLQLQLRALPVDARLSSPSSLQDDLATRLATMLELELSDKQRRSMAAGSTGIREAFFAYVEGMGYLRLDQPDKAIASFQRAIKEDAFYSSPHCGLAEAFRLTFHRTSDRRYLDLASNAAQAGLQKSREDPIPEAHSVLGSIFYDLRRYDDAIDSYRRALDLDPVSPPTRNNLVRAYVAVGRFPEAEQVLEQGVRIRPDCWHAHYYLGNFYRTRGRLADAETHFRRVVELAPRSPRGHSNLGVVLYHQQRWTEAEAAYKQALELEPRANTYSNLGMLYRDVGCLIAAAGALERAAEKEPGDYLIRGNLAELFRLIPGYEARAPGMFHKAIELAESGKGRTVDQKQLLRNLAFYHARLGEKQKALTLITEAVDLDRNDIFSLYRAGLLYELIGDRDLAVTTLRRAFERSYPAKELCGDPQWLGLRHDTRLSVFLNNECARFEQMPSPAQPAFVCPETRTRGRGSRENLTN